MIIVFAISFFLILPFFVTAQNMQPLSIGDKVPDIEFKMLNNVSKKKLSDFKGKLIILDFWATWCGACVKALPRIDSLQMKYTDRLQVMLVTTKLVMDEERDIIKFFGKIKHKDGSPYQLAYATEDSLLDQLFPHQTVPHYVWINPEGRVEAITSSNEITSENILNVINNKRQTIPLKRDLFANKPLHLDEELAADDFLHYSVLLKGRLKDPSSFVLRRFYKGESRGLVIKNTPLIEMYREAIRSFDDRDLIDNKKRMIVQVADSSKLYFDLYRALEEDGPDKENIYTYDLITPPINETDIYRYLLNDLNRYSNYYGRVEKRKQQCFALIRTSTEDKINTKGERPDYKLNRKSNPYLKNLPVSRLVFGLNRIQSIKPIVIDETGYADNIDISFLTDLNIFSIATLRSALQQYDLDLVEVEREMAMFVVTDKKDIETLSVKRE